MASDENLSNIQVLRVRAFHNFSPQAFETLINSPHWTGVLDFDYATNAEGAVHLVAASPLLRGLVSFGCSEYRDSAPIPVGKQLPLLRRINESLSLTVFTDARHAKRWLEAGPSTPLRARLEAFVERIYSQEDPRSTEQIIAELRKMNIEEDGWEEVEDRVGRDIAALLAKVFNGRPIPEGTAFRELTASQQAALQLVQEVGAEWWSVDTIIREPLASYGLDFYEDDYQEFLSGECVSR